MRALEVTEGQNIHVCAGVSIASACDTLIAELEENNHEQL